VSVLISDLTERKMHEALRELDRRKSEFIALLSHELRDPLSAVRMAVSILQRSRELQAADRSAVDLIDRQTRQLTRLIDDVLDMSKIEQGMIELTRRPVDLRTVIEQSLESAMSLLRQNDHHVETRLPQRPVVLSADHGRLSQVFLNLLGNAARYTPAGGRVSVLVETPAPYDGKRDVVVRVRDNGIGMTQEQMSLIFEPFIKAAKSSGLGLGLALSRRLVELHGGRLEVFSDGLGQGSEFVVRLPLAPD
jgi:signal transduction histidine kinase